MLLFAMCAFLSLRVYSGERCIAVDGDTLLCNHEKVRLMNVYAAELNQLGGRAAKRRLQMFVASGDLALRRLGHDRYGRTLAEVYVNGRRIEQSDIGPRAGRGVQARREWHHRIRIRKVRGAERGSRIVSR